MSENIVKLFTTAFSTNLELKLQQKGSKLRGTVDEGMYVGKQVSPIQQVNPLVLKAPAGRFAPKTNQNADFVRRWIMPQDGEINQLLDSFDVLKTTLDPKSKLIESAANGVARGWDDSLIAASTAASTIGTDPGSFSTENFDTGNFQIASTFASSAATGLTVAKLIEAKRILRHYHVDMEEEQVTLVMGSQQESDLLNQAQVVSTDFNEKPVLVEGRIKRFMGFNFMLSERLNQASSVRTVLAYAKSGMHLGMWMDMTHDVDQRKDLSGHPWQLYTQTSFGAARMQLGRLIAILCADTTGADVTP